MSYQSLILSLKGGSGSGNHGHSGIPGHVGGSTPGSSSIALVNNVGELRTTKFGRAFIITPDQKLIDVSNMADPNKDHNDFIKANSQAMGLGEVTDANLDDTWGKLFRQGYVKVRDLKEEVDIRTDRVDATTLRYMQRLYDNDKLSIKPDQKVYWEAGNNDTYTTASLEEFLSAKHVIKGYRSELKELLRKKQLVKLQDVC